MDRCWKVDRSRVAAVHNLVLKHPGITAVELHFHSRLRRSRLTIDNIADGLRVLVALGVVRLDTSKSNWTYWPEKG